MFAIVPMLPPWILLDPILSDWSREDLGRGDHSAQGLGLEGTTGKATWVAKSEGIIAGLPIAFRMLQLLDPQVKCTAKLAEGFACGSGQVIAELEGPLASLLSGERAALNVAMRLSGVATATRRFVDQLADLPTQFVDTRKTTPGLRLLEKYATRVGGGTNHRLGLDDAVMVKDNHIAAAGGSIAAAIKKLRSQLPFPLIIEVETETLGQVMEAISAGVGVIMLDNMNLAQVQAAVQVIRDRAPRTKIEVSSNISLENIRAIAETGVDYISSSAPITRSPWLDISMRLQ
ncbi:nicotinate-nucleotide pyrophosphorylase [Synechococcus elongatus PCC 6301]|uniref:Probable nicotinate-nucleotide pyrophosphorylase [carboxylating] n=2 Tax=Synechococcus elongatus TaxID=32046 RepID=A0A0H3K0H3_SYNP6|nr:nicotinate-nucleotide pyrophosphorylase [Synechococcus elongatus PCC 6301]